MTVRMTDGHALPFDPKLPGNSSSSTSSHKGNPPSSMFCSSQIAWNFYDVLPPASMTISSPVIDPPNTHIKNNWQQEIFTWKFIAIPRDISSQDISGG